jgi:hypothetical protein
MVQKIVDCEMMRRITENFTQDFIFRCNIWWNCIFAALIVGFDVILMSKRHLMNSFCPLLPVLDNYESWVKKFHSGLDIKQASMTAGYPPPTKISADYNYFSTKWHLTLHDFSKNQIDAANSVVRQHCNFIDDNELHLLKCFCLSVSWSFFDS